MSCSSPTLPPRSWEGGASLDEAVEQVLRNANVTVRNPGAGDAGRRLLIGRTDGGRTLTLVVEPTIEPSAWLVIAGWTSERERKMLGG
jgi:hypothetical protein